MDRQYYNTIADEDELKWFFDNVMGITKRNDGNVWVQAGTSYMVSLVSRCKRLSLEERVRHGFRSSNFLQCVAVYGNSEGLLSYEKFYEKLARLNVDKRAYVGMDGEPYPDDSLVCYFYPNPTDDVACADDLISYIIERKSELLSIMRKSFDGNIDWKSIGICSRKFSKLDSRSLSMRQNRKARKDWVDFDFDFDGEKYFPSHVSDLQGLCDRHYGKHTSVIIRTHGGCHILVRAGAIKADPKLFIDDVKASVSAVTGCDADSMEGKTNRGIGVPLPGTYQYGVPVVVLNKDAFLNG